MTYRDLDLDTYQDLSGVELGRRVAAGELSPVHLAECALALVDRDEPEINAYAAVMHERARRTAAEREREAADGRLRGPLHGVPIASKDNLYLEGEVPGKGSRTSPETPATTSSPMVERLLGAGAVVVGRTTTPEFGWKGTGISPRTGVSRNPWDPSRNTGGSSAGSGATVGAGAVPIATGTDAGGSVRIPAAFCGTVGLKPTLSAIPVWPGTVNENLSHAGVLTRRVEDAALVLELTAGPDPRDPQSSYAAPLVPPVTGRRLRVAVVAEPWGIAPSDEVAAVFADAVRRLRATGVADLVDATLPGPLPRSVFEALWVTGRGLGFRDLFAEHAAVMDPGLVRLGDLAQGYQVADLLDALSARRAFNQAMFAFAAAWDVVLMPTMPLTAFGAEDEVPAGGEADAPLPWITWTPYTYPFNITGQPAVSVPVRLGPGHLPVGVQVAGAWAQDRTVLAFAQVCEDLLAGTVQRRVARPARLR
ncbi:amidase [Nocardioides mangrovi]|uniref:Amidase n=1 Tax=Nocardioides mangrovi TaxID=2874580 RepID=A0ABS7UER6_9ACTN|nr:amidase family protein [Nocardioides mangrovi]MBZ5739509.1 amidase [Nocardioides mangrovi]